MLVKLLKRYFIVFLLLLIVLCSCVPNKYSKNDRERITAEGKKVIESYLKTLPDKPELADCYMFTAAEIGAPFYAGYYLSSLVQGVYYTENRRCRVIVNLETGEMWTNIGFPDVNAVIRKDLEEYCLRYGYKGEIEVSEAQVCYRVISHDMPIKGNKNNVIDTEVFFEDVIPVGMSVDEMLHGADMTPFTVYYESDGEYLDNRVLFDYLKESDNYLHFENRDYNYCYKLIGTERRQGLSLSSSADYMSKKWSEELWYSENLDDMEYERLRYARTKEGDFNFFFVDASTNGSFSVDDEVTLEFKPDLRIEGNSIIYSDEGPSVAVYFTSKPQYTEFSRTFKNESSDSNAEPEKLSVWQTSNGCYSLTDGKVESSVVYWLSRSQKIDFK